MTTYPQVRREFKPCAICGGKVPLHRLLCLECAKPGAIKEAEAVRREHRAKSWLGQLVSDLRGN
jgi:hypothetical protein